MLAILARTGQFLPKCLTLGPHNGPEDFAYVVDRISPGRTQKRRFCKEWLAYVDDLTIRTGRVLDGVLTSDAENTRRIRDAARHAHAEAQTAESALQEMEMGFLPDGLGRELEGGKKATRANTKKEIAQSSRSVASGSGVFPSPIAHQCGGNVGFWTWMAVFWIGSTFQSHAVTPYVPTTVTRLQKCLTHKPETSSTDAGGIVHHSV